MRHCRVGILAGKVGQNFTEDASCGLAETVDVGGLEVVGAAKVSQRGLRQDGFPDAVGAMQEDVVGAVAIMAGVPCTEERVLFGAAMKKSPWRCSSSRQGGSAII